MQTEHHESRIIFGPNHCVRFAANICKGNLSMISVDLGIENNRKSSMLSSSTLCGSHLYYTE